ncbi:unknown [Proteobacteria bacterium CAG:139]|nr:unknown [Proteobacteria bacterium CAG:139]
MAAVAVLDTHMESTPLAKRKPPTIAGALVPTSFNVVKAMRLSRRQR